MQLHKLNFYDFFTQFVDMSSNETTSQQESVLPEYGRLFYEQKSDFLFCQPHLMPLKSITLEKLERMQKQAIAQLKEKRANTAAALDK